VQLSCNCRPTVDHLSCNGSSCCRQLAAQDLSDLSASYGHQQLPLKQLPGQDLLQHHQDAAAAEAAAAAAAATQADTHTVAVTTAGSASSADALPGDRTSVFVTQRIAAGAVGSASSTGSTGSTAGAVQLVVYRHNDLAHLQQLLEGTPAAARKMVVTDSLFSMDGDFADLRVRQSVEAVAFRQARQPGH